MTRLRNANQPNTKASAPGTAMTMRAANQKWSKPYQYQGSSFQSRNTMKSGRSLRYTPSPPMERIRYMPMA